jgi:hypothetical protein
MSDPGRRCYYVVEQAQDRWLMALGGLLWGLLLGGLAGYWLCAAGW